MKQVAQQNGGVASSEESEYGYYRISSSIMSVRRGLLDLSFWLYNISLWESCILLSAGILVYYLNIQ